MQSTNASYDHLERLVAAGRWTWDVAGDQLTWSPELSRIYGLAEDEAPDGYAGFLDMVHDADRAHTRETVERAFRERKDAQYVHRIVRADGEVRVLRSAVHVQTGPDGDVVVMSGACQDVTEQTSRAQRDERLRALATSGVVAAGLAHDLNNMVGALVMSAGILARLKSSPSTRREVATRVRDLSERIGEITSRIQLLGRPCPIEHVPLDVVREVQRTVDAVGDVLPARVELRAHLMQTGAVMGNPTDLERVMWNLLVNARDAIGRAGAIVVTTEQVTVENDDHRGRYARISVLDDGEGMDPSTVARVFEPFVSSKGDQGTGLGLAVVLDVVESMGGFVTVESSPGMGTQIRVHLPIHAPDAAAPPM